MDNSAGGPNYNPNFSRQKIRRIETLEAQVKHLEEGLAYAFDALKLQSDMLLMLCKCSHKTTQNVQKQTKKVQN